MSERFDVVIAGAGPAGAQCARDLAARNYDVVVLETESEDEFPRQSNKSTAGTFPSMMASFSIPDDVVMQYTDKVVLESPNDYYIQDQAGAVLEFGDFKRFLVSNSREDGAEYRFDSRVTAPITEDGEVVGVRYNGDEEVYSEIVIDATGPAAPLAKKLDVCDLKRKHQAIGVEYEFENVDVNHPEYADLRDAMMLRLDHDLAPGGYSWIFHTGDRSAKVGLCYIQNESHEEYAKDGMGIDDYLNYWLDRDPRFDDAVKLEEKQHRGSAHIQRPDSMSTDSFMAIGDTVPTIDPLWGEGIHKGMKSARMAAITADACLTPDDPNTDAETMATYDKLWHSEVAPRARERLLMTELLYLVSNDRYDRLMHDLKEVGAETLARVNAGDKRAISKLLHLSDLPTLVKYARRRLST